MPFVIGDLKSIPKKYRHYKGIINSCPVEEEQLGKIGYLTIHESRVEAGAAQRRGGVHIECPGVVLLEGTEYVTANENREKFLAGHEADHAQMVLQR